VLDLRMSYSLTRKQPILPHERNRFSAKLRSILPCTYGHSCKQKHFGQGEGGEIGRRVRTGCQSTDRFVCNTSGNCCRLELVPSQCLALFSTQNEQRAKNPKATFVQTRIEDDMSIHARKIIFKNNTYYQVQSCSFQIIYGTTLVAARQKNDALRIIRGQRAYPKHQHYTHHCD